MTNKIASYEDVKDVIAGDLVFIDAKAGNMHIGFHATTPADKFRLYLISVTLMKADNPLTLLLQPSHRPLTAKVSVRKPSLSKSRTRPRGRILV